MTTARIARGGAAPRRAPARKGKGRGRAKAKPPGLLESLPISAKTLRKLMTWGIALAAIVVLTATAFAMRIPQRIGTAIGEGIGAAGFTVSRVELRGLDRLDPSAITKSALAQPSLAMPLLDLDAIRDTLMHDYKWIKEARVHRRLPDTLVVEIVERTPAAVWQLNQRLQLVDGEGAELEPVRADAMPDGLPLVVGPGAQHQIAGLARLIDAAPQVREVYTGASWIGGRRWDLRFRSGETLSLPEGEAEAQAALRKFMEMNAREPMLGGANVRFDMRIDGRMIVQRRTAPGAQSRVPASSPGSAAPARPADPPQDLSRTI